MIEPRDDDVPHEHDKRRHFVEVVRTLALLSAGTLDLNTERVCIIGPPRSGKTTLASTMTNVRHTDDLIGILDWSAASEHVADEWLMSPGPWVIEGVAVVRALRKWLASHSNGKRCDRVIVMTQTHVELSKGQAAKAKGHEKIWQEVRPLLLARGVAIEERSA